MFRQFAIRKQKRLLQELQKVENNLLLNAEIIFADSTIQHFNIYERMKYYKVPSVSIAVINNGKLEWAKAYGLADISETKSVNTSTLYQAASLSKSINAPFFHFVWIFTFEENTTDACYFFHFCIFIRLVVSNAICCKAKSKYGCKRNED